MVRMRAPARLNRSTRFFGARLVTATMTGGPTKKMREVGGVRAEPSTMMRIGLFPLTYLTVKRGLSCSRVPTPIITASCLLLIK